MDVVKLKITALTNVGCVRDNNEDNFIISSDLSNNNWTFQNSDIELGEKGALLVVADGMGGMNAGEVASEIAIKTIKKVFSESLGELEKEEQIVRFLSNAIKVADREIVEHANKNHESEGMGTTIVIGWIFRDCLYVGWCGDSRAYVYDSVGGLKQISKDHSYVQSLIDKGVITKEQAFYHPDNNIIMRSLGNPDNKAKPDVVTYPLIKGMKILLCSDGLNGMLEDEKIEEIMKQHSDIDACKENLVMEALDAGGHDNVTVVLCEIIDLVMNEEQNEKSSEEKKSTKDDEKKIHFGKKTKWTIIFVVLLVLMGLAFYGLYKYNRNNLIQFNETKFVMTDTIVCDSVSDTISIDEYIIDKQEDVLDDTVGEIIREEIITE